MQRQRRISTDPEVRLRKQLHAAGYRYRIGYRIPGAPRRTIDIAFSRSRVAVFVDGCFWHACPEHATQPRANAEWWQQKLAANVERDRDTDALLAAAGWRVVRVWEHEADDAALAQVVTALAGR